MSDAKTSARFLASTVKRLTKFVWENESSDMFISASSAVKNRLSPYLSIQIIILSATKLVSKSPFLIKENNLFVKPTNSATFVI